MLTTDRQLSAVLSRVFTGHAAPSVPQFMGSGPTSTLRINALDGVVAQAEACAYGWSLGSGSHPAHVSLQWSSNLSWPRSTSSPWPAVLAPPRSHRWPPSPPPSRWPVCPAGLAWPAGADRARPGLIGRFTPAGRPGARSLAGLLRPPLTIGLRRHKKGVRPDASRRPTLEESVATYEYRCSHCGCFVQRMPMGTATAFAACPTCGQDAKRVFSAPMTYRTAKPLATMLAREEASRDHPQVVDRVPPRRRLRRTTPPNPALARLPKP
jgi:putative FmdB family regulatory protein